MEKFIECVRRYPSLWNPQDPGYSDVHARGHAWQRVIDDLKDDSIPNIKVARKEWRRLRDSHREALKRAKLGQNKLLPAHITTWKYAKAMQFLEPHMKYRITEHIEMEPSTTPLQTDNTDHDVSTSDLNNITENRTNKRRHAEDTEHILSKRFEQDSDALESFFQCILKTTREMPQWMQTQVKKKIFAVIIDAEEMLSVQRQTAEPIRTDAYAILETKIKTEYMDDTIIGN